MRSLGIIGEVTKNTSVTFREKYSKIQWKEVAGLRDKLIHHYFGVNWEIVWDVIKNLIP
ncbi:MAG: DUF86 domain-containing protein [Planctomycetia bacterium]|nr:DUF86 domain-containing protein [Planctomycetia bacterium]